VAATTKVMLPNMVARMPVRRWLAPSRRLYGARTLASNEVIELSNNFPADGLGAEHHARDSGCDEQYRCDRKTACSRRATRQGGVRRHPTMP